MLVLTSLKRELKKCVKRNVTLALHDEDILLLVECLELSLELDDAGKDYQTYNKLFDKLDRKLRKLHKTINWVEDLK